MLQHASNAFVVPERAAAYLSPAARESLPARVTRALEELRCCTACPRKCRVNRLAGRTGVCRTGRHAQVCSAFAHMGEEECLRGCRGSGTVFFSMCNLRCVFCQNSDISQQASGREFDPSALARVMLTLQACGCHNINLVTPEHVVPHLVEALAIAVDRGLRVPLVYNTSAYDSLSSLRLMDGLVDVYMPDFKLASSEAAERLLQAKDYPQRARDAILEMHRQVGDLRFTSNGLACRGLLVRHLVMPGMLEESRKVFRWLADEVSPDTYVNIMGQYHPANKVGRLVEHETGQPDICYEDINRHVSSAELRAAYAAARAAGLWRFDKPLAL